MAQSSNWYRHEFVTAIYLLPLNSYAGHQQRLAFQNSFPWVPEKLLMCKVFPTPDPERRHWMTDAIKTYGLSSVLLLSAPIQMSCTALVRKYKCSNNMSSACKLPSNDKVNFLRRDRGYVHLSTRLPMRKRACFTCRARRQLYLIEIIVTKSVTPTSGRNP